MKMQEEAQQFCYERLCNRTAMHLESALQAIQPRKRRVVELRCIADLDFDEIAQTLGIDEKSAKTYFTVAVRQLRQAYAAAEYSKRGQLGFEQAALRRAYNNSVFHK